MWVSLILVYSDGYLPIFAVFFVVHHPSFFSKILESGSVKFELLKCLSGVECVVNS